MEEERKYGWRDGIKDLASYFGCVGLFISIPVVLAFTSWCHDRAEFINTHRKFMEPRPIKRVYSRYVNSDGLGDMVVEYKTRGKTVFYGTGAGYVTLDQIEKIREGGNE